VADCVQVTTTLPDEQSAERIAVCLVEERLAACAQVLGPVSSTYRWQGEVERAWEWYCHLKTSTARLPELQRRLRELHPYEVPEIIAVPIVQGDADYLRWIGETVTTSPLPPEPGTGNAGAPGAREKHGRNNTQDGTVDSH
jgi:periplasmic divalent cation tolerance protein